jgi:hypothetical protein
MASTNTTRKAEQKLECYLNENKFGVGISDDHASRRDLNVFVIPHGEYWTLYLKNGRDTKALCWVYIDGNKEPDAYLLFGPGESMNLRGPERGKNQGTRFVMTSLDRESVEGKSKGDSNNGKVRVVWTPLLKQKPLTPHHVVDDSWDYGFSTRGLEFDLGTPVFRSITLTQPIYRSLSLDPIEEAVTTYSGSSGHKWGHSSIYGYDYDDLNTTEITFRLVATAPLPPPPCHVTKAPPTFAELSVPGEVNDEDGEVVTTDVTS